MENLNIRTERFQNIHYQKTGKGPLLILLHGFPEDGRLWGPVIPGLSASFTLIVPDLPGSGESSLASADATLDLLAESLRAILKNEEAHKAVLAGHSMGGYVSLAFAEKNKEWLKGLSLIHSTATPDTEEKKVTRRKTIELVRKGGKDTFINGMVPGLFSGSFKEQHPDVVAQQVARGLKLKDESIIAFYNAMINRPDRTAVLKDAGFPVQWVMGREDNVVPLDIALQQSRLAYVNFVSVYPQCGHMSMLEKPGELVNDLSEFCHYCYRN